MSAVLTEDDVDVRLKGRCDLPAFYDDEEPPMGETWLHSSTEAILWFSLMALIEDNNLDATAIPDMFFYYSAKAPKKNVAPDLMVVPARIPTEDLTSYRLHTTGPMPVFVAEVLSLGTWEKVDLEKKRDLYLELGIDEYLLVDPEFQFMEHRLILKTRRGKRWIDQFDSGNGVESKLGCRFTIDDQVRLRVIDVKTNRPIPRPDEARQLQKSLHESEQIAKQMEAEIARLKALLPPNTGS